MASLTGVELIQAERRRQIEKGYGAEHDDKRTDYSISVLAYRVIRNAVARLPLQVCVADDSDWPDEWSKRLDEKYKDKPVKQLTIAGALIAAEIDRLQRKQQATNG